MKHHSLTLDKKIDLSLLDINYNQPSLMPGGKREKKNRHLSKASGCKNKRKHYSNSKVKSSSIRRKFRKHKKVSSISVLSSLSDVKFYPLKSNKRLLLWDNDFIQKMKSDEIQKVLITMKDIEIWEDNNNR